MRKTYMTTMPDEVGAFLQASKIIAEYEGNITRVSYNRAVDSRLLFIEVEADKEILDDITQKLDAIGYLLESPTAQQPLLISMHLLDKSGTVLPILEVIDRYHLNISYMSSEANDSGWQDYKMAMVIDDVTMTRQLLEELSLLCETTILDYNPTEKLLDNTVFYLSFAQDMRQLLTLDQAQTNECIINSNVIMQLLDEQDESPFKTFEYIRKFASTVVKHKGDAFQALIDVKNLGSEALLYLIEPPCGSNIFVIDNGDTLVFVDGGFPCYQEEMKQTLISLFKDFDQREKILLLTHADIDHIGLAFFCDEIIASEDCRENFALETAGANNFREQSRKDAPYVRLSKLITGYSTPIDPNRITTYGAASKDSPLAYADVLSLANLEFECYEGNGGHVRGESVYICRSLKLAFTGDNLVNIKGFSRDQTEFNKYAPYLMSSVNTDSEKATAIREELERELTGYFICPGHGRWFELL